MKTILAIIIALFCLNTFSAELTTGSMVNYHYMNSFSKLKNKLTSNGRYVISPYYLEYRYKDISFFTSRDCLNQPIFGGMYKKKVFQVGDFKTELAAGWYSLNEKEWNKVAKQYWLKGGVVPLVGAINTLEVYKYKKTSIEIKNSVFPLIIQTGIFLKVEF